MYFNVYMYICKSIFINIIVLEPAFLVLVNDRLVLGEWLRVVNQCCLTTQSHCNLSYMLLGSSNNLQDTYMQYLYILHLWLRQDTQTEQQNFLVSLTISLRRVLWKKDKTRQDSVF